MLEKRTITTDAKKCTGQTITVFGWVNARRDHGKIIFLDVRDRWGILQVVFIPNKEAYKVASEIRDEFVVCVTGTVNRRPDNMVNDKIPTGSVELLAEEIQVFSASETTPFSISDTEEVGEESRLKYRYLDLRTSRMLSNLTKRLEVNNFIRNWLTSKSFIEVETPILTKSTPEGARDYIVPSRLQKGKFYALPQAPQQYKQLLMVSGIEKYFQIARCFRDEDLRGDRQPEFTQLDIEMSFVDSDDIINLLEELMIEMLKSCYPNKKVKTPFEKLTWQESMKKHKSDKPDLRKNKDDKDELAFAWIIDFPLFERDEENKLTSLHHPFTSFYKEDEKLLESNPVAVRSHAFDLVLNGTELGSGSIRIHDPKTQETIFKMLGISDNEIQNRFGHLLRAFKYGVPPHGGMAWGLDRLLMILQGEESVREVIAFPKTQEGKDLMMEAPTVIEEKQLREAHIKIREK